MGLAERILFTDRRLKERATILVGQIFTKIGETIPAACQDRANAKAAYRFFDNDSVSEDHILSGHLQATEERIAACDGPVLFLHDTTEHCFKREAGAMQRDGKKSKVTVRRILMHSSMAFTPDALPLGMTSVKFWEHDRSAKKEKKKTSPGKVPVEEKKTFRWLESMRQATASSSDPSSCVHIGDRESDIYELFSLASELGTHFLVRIAIDRRPVGDDSTIADEIEASPVRGVHCIEFKDSDGKSQKATLELKFQEMEVHPPKDKKDQHSSQVLTVIYAVERDKPEGREPIVWKLLTSLPVKTTAEAIEKLNWYAMRWKIEVFHKILKSGCRVEESELRSTERLTNFIAVCCIVAWRVFWMTMLNRFAQDAPASVALTETERRILDQLLPNSPSSTTAPTISDYILKIAKLGGYLANPTKRPPGNQVIWRGLKRLSDIEVGFLAALKTCG